MVSTETSRYFSYLYKEQWICFLTCSFMKKAQVYNVLVVLLYNFHCMLFSCLHLLSFSLLFHIWGKTFNSKKKKHFFKIIVWITNVVKICFKMWQNIVFSSNYPWRMNCCCLQHVTKWNQLDFVACCRQQNSKSKMLQDNNLTMGDPVKHFHSTCKKHVFVAAAPANFPGSLAV